MDFLRLGENCDSGRGRAWRVSLPVLRSPAFFTAARNRKCAQANNSCTPAQMVCCTEADGCSREMVLEEAHPAKYLFY